LFAVEADAVDAHQPVRLVHGRVPVIGPPPHNATPGDAQYLRDCSAAIARQRQQLGMTYDDAVAVALRRAGVTSLC
jgi:hypothetical protein